jgi:hypothetical protein
MIMALSDTLSTRRLFSVEEANRMLPLVRPIVSDIVRQFQIVTELKSRMDAVRPKVTRKRQNDPYREELAQTEAELDREQARLTDYVDELTKLGVELRGVDGLCDFPSLREGREVFLCWRLGEPEVMFWHDVDAGFAGRQPIEPSPQAVQPEASVN